MQTNKYIFFDCMGTLFSNPIDWERENLKGAELLKHFFLEKNVLVEMNDDLTEKIIAEKRILRKKAKEEMVEYPLDALLRKHLKERDIPYTEDLIDQAVKVYMYPEVKISRPYEGTKELLDKLKNAGYFIALISNTLARSFVDTVINSHGMTEYFDYVLTSYDVGYRKPHRNFILRFCEDTGADVRNSIWIGDRLKDDIHGANTIGMKNIFFNRDFHPDNQKFRGIIKPYREAKTTEEIYPLIQEIFE